MSYSRFILSIALCAATVALAGDGLDIKTGLWQVTYTSEVQIARGAAGAKQSAPRGPRTWTSKTCVTAKDLQEGAFKMDQEDEDMHCKYTITAQTRSLQDGTMACSGGGMSSTGAVHVEAQGRERVVGYITNTGMGMSTNFTINGKWLSVSCAGADDE